jgi:glycosyltransferase involved in cell wall biosynthesis
MVVLNIVDSASPVNYGIWNAAVGMAKELKELGISTELWYPALEEEPQLTDVVQRPLESTYLSHLQYLWKTEKWDPAETVVMTHGCWRFPTRWGVFLRRKGYRWIAVPHGMLEPWSLKRKAWKKWVYFQLYERWALGQADAIRAVSSNELRHLDYFFPKEKLIHIPNGVPKRPMPDKPDRPPFHFLFLGRLHAKKGVYELVQAWSESPLRNFWMYRLTIAGPDQGERARIEQLIRQKRITNIDLPGPLYGQEKEALLEKSHFFLLPSHSEGFPTAVLEALSYGLLPLISEGCNFPELLEQKLALQVEPDKDSILHGLEQAAQLKFEELTQLCKAGYALVMEQYSLQTIAREIGAWVNSE